MLKDTGSGVRRSWLKPMLCHSLALQSRVCPLVCKAGLTPAPGSADTALAEQRPAMISMTLSCVPGNWTNSLHSFFFFVRFYLSIARERRREGGKKRKHICVVASHMPPTGDLAHNLGMCPDRESNQQPFALQAGTQSTEPQQPGYFMHS